MLIAVREQGGTVLLDRAAPPPRKSISGVVFDSSTGQPAAGATVSIQGTAISAVTGKDGRFEIRGVPQGLYSIVASSPALDSLGVPGPADTVRITARGGPDVALAIPSRATLAATMCQRQASDSRLAVLRVTVLDSSRGVPVSNSPARVWWRKFTGAMSSGNLTEHDEGYVAQLDSLGRFTACDLPSDALLHVESPRDAGPGWSDTLRVAPGEVGWRVLRVRKSGP